MPMHASFTLGACVYRGDGSLDYILHPEGVVRATGQGLSHEYFLKDHLGNTRVVFDSNGAVLQATDYYAFGMEHTPKAKENENRYLYNGKELQDETFAGGVRLGWYDYGARMYDAQLGRWHCIDPMAELSRRWSPYSYAYDNPIRFVDVDGLIPWPILANFNGFKRRHEDNYGDPRPKGRTHKGVDMNYEGAGDKDRGSTIVATHDGYVVSVTGVNEDKDAGGSRITIRSKDGTLQTSYMHMDKKPKFKAGDKIHEGQKIGKMGKSGGVNEEQYASHLHYEIATRQEDGRYEKINPIGSDGQPIDPQTMLNPDEDFAPSGVKSEVTLSAAPKPSLSDKLHESRIPIVKTFGDIFQAIGF